jgi:uracil-DNA glycosylase
MSKTLDLDEIKQKILIKLQPSGWDRVLKSFINSSDFENIIKELAKQSRDGKRFTPSLKYIFRAFEECPYNELKVVMVGQDPYPHFGVADGIAFSCSLTEQEQPSFKYLLDAIDRTVHDNQGIVDRNPDLKRWSNQGILMLNTALTTNVGKVGQHYLIWRPFIAYLFDWLTWHNNGLIYLYLGNEAKKWSDAVNDNNYKFYTSHPASAAYNGNSIWECGDVFKEIYKITMKQYNHVIIW